MFLLLTRKNKDILQTLHPVTTVVFFSVLLTMGLIFTHPLYLVMLLLLAAWGILHERGWEQWKPILLMGVGITVFIVVINLFVSRNGSTVLWESPRIFFFGKIFFTQESLGFAFVMGLKLITVFSLSTYFGLCLSFDQTFGFFYRMVPHSTQVLILSVMMFPKMGRRLKDVYEVMRLRGASMNGGALSARISAHIPLLKVLLLSGLEDSWQMGEALYARGYGCGRERTHYAKVSIQKTDCWVWVLSMLMLAVLVKCGFEGRGSMEFYPLITGTIDSSDGMNLLAIALCGLGFVYLNLFWKRWTFLR